MSEQTAWIVFAILLVCPPSADRKDVGWGELANSVARLGLAVAVIVVLATSAFG